MLALVITAVWGLALGASKGAPSEAHAAPFKLSLPLQCPANQTCPVQNYVDVDPGPGARDYLCGVQTNQAHNGVDFRIEDMAAQLRGVSVLAAASGEVLRIRNDVPDISINAAGASSVTGRECGNGLIIDHGDGWQTQYCHLAKGSVVVQVGQRIARGVVLGRVGLSGMTEFPHLHLTVRHKGVVVDPFRPNSGADACSPIAGEDLWESPARQLLTYRAGAVLNAGFSNSIVTKAAIEEGRVTAPSLLGRFLVGYVRAIHLKAGDVQVFTMRGPRGDILATETLAPIDRDEAQSLASVGVRRPDVGWMPGVYEARYQVLRSGQVVVSASFSSALEKAPPK